MRALYITDLEYMHQNQEYGVSVCFYCKMVIFGKTVGINLLILSEKWNFLKPIKTYI
jgi:hypothetical protein